MGSKLNNHPYLVLFNEIDTKALLRMILTPSKTLEIRKAKNSVISGFHFVKNHLIIGPGHFFSRGFFNFGVNRQFPSRELTNHFDSGQYVYVLYVVYIKKVFWLFLGFFINKLKFHFNKTVAGTHFLHIDILKCVIQLLDFQ